MAGYSHELQQLNTTIVAAELADLKSRGKKQDQDDNDPVWIATGGATFKFVMDKKESMSLLEKLATKPVLAVIEAHAATNELKTTALKAKFEHHGVKIFHGKKDVDLGRDLTVSGFKVKNEVGLIEWTLVVVGQISPKAHMFMYSNPHLVVNIEINAEQTAEIPGE